MKTKSGSVSLFILLFFSILFSCKQNKEIIPSADYAPYINAYTGGMISSQSPIRVEFAQDIPVVELNVPVSENLFDFSPSLKGKAYWVSNRAIEFVPDSGQLKGGQIYNASFKLDKVMSVKKGLEKFEFSFHVLGQSFSIHKPTYTVFTEKPEVATVEGDIRFSDKIGLDDVNKMFSISCEGDNSFKLKIEPTDNPKIFHFVIENIIRNNTDRMLEIKVSGKTVNIDQEIEEKVLIPALGSFKFLSAEAILTPENGIEVVFSDPVSQVQDLRGLIEISEIKDYVYQIEGNKVKIYFERNELTKVTLNIDKGLQNQAGESLGVSTSVSVSIELLKPKVEFLHTGTILPDSKNLIIPFKSVNLWAVDLKIVRIYEKNILMFMQSNSLSTSNELKRCGRLIYRTTIRLDEDPTKDLNQWNNFSIDLSKIINQEPGAIYKVEIYFKQDYSLYTCDGTVLAKGQEERLTTLDTEDESDENSETFWDTPNSYYSPDYEYVDWNEYNWSETDDPCKPSYYMSSSNISVSCNILASNLGIIVKGNSENKLWVTVNNILDTQPMNGVNVTAYNYQLQVIGNSKTDGEGFAVVECKGKPFILVAETEKEKGYLRLVDGEEKSLSRFDIGGEFPQKGLKGYVFGERGVWRPGDTLHLSFILEDRNKKIPENHPVTIEIYNPKGQFYTKQTSTTGINGFYTFKIPTDPDDLTGAWNGYVKVGGATFHKSLRIETIKPNRLKINLQLPGTRIDASAGSFPVKFSSNWLTGAIARNLKADVEMTLNRIFTQFKGYEDYNFNNPVVAFKSQSSKVFEGYLDDQGNTSFDIKSPSSLNAPGMLQATLISRVYEPGGDVSTYIQSMPYSSFSSYVGVKVDEDDYDYYLETDKAHTIDIVTLNPDGKPVDRRNIEYRVYKMDWNWWWETSENFENYVNNSSRTPIASADLSTKGGKASAKLQVNYPDWGRYLIYIKDMDSGHATGKTVYIDWPSWRGRSDRKDPDGVSMLSFSTDKKEYEVGEDVTVIVPAAAKGKALVALENGIQVLKREWIDIPEQGDTKYTFKVTEDMAPNFYIHISLLQPHAQTVNDLPIRLYGVVPVMVTNKNSKLYPEISMPQSLQPEKNFNITIKEKTGRAMTYTIAIVDEGLLDLTAFKTPDPWNFFYAREALGIKTWDLYDFVIGSFGGRFSSLFSIGGDENLNPSNQKANRFKPVVKFIGPFALKKGETQTHTLQLPMYVGSVRTMVIAEQDGSYGNAEKTVPVKNPLMILSTLPRVISVGEEIMLPVNVFAMENQVKDVTVKVETSGLAQITSGKSQSLKFSKVGDQMAYFSLKTGDKTGVEKVKIIASGNGQTATETIEIQVRNPNPPIIVNVNKLIHASETQEFNYDLTGNPDENWAKMEISRIPSIDMNRRFYYLMHYEHGCTEQTTSKAFPLLYIGDFKKMTPAEDEAVKKRIQDAIRVLYSRQLPDGGFMYWPGQAYSYDWISSYAGHFLCEARKKGFDVNQNVINRWTEYQRKLSRDWTYNRNQLNPRYSYYQYDLEQAYRLYTLALAGSPETGSMNRMKEMKNLSLQSKWRLAAAYALDGKTSVAKELIFNLQNNVDPYTSSNSTYGSSSRDEAMILETMVLIGDIQKAFEQAKKVSRNLSDEYYFSTQSTAYSLLAMGKLVEKTDKGMIEVSWSFNGKGQPDIKTALAVNQVDIPSNVNAGKIDLKNIGQGDLFVAFTTKSTPLRDTLPAISRNLKLDVLYKDMSGKILDVSEIKQGTDFIASIAVSNISGTDSYTDLALTHIIPSGWEIFNERMMTVSGGATSSGYTYRDIRDDRVLTYFDLYKGQSKTFQIRLQATYVGKYILPAVQCEAMYDTESNARTRVGTTEVVK